MRRATWLAAWAVAGPIAIGPTLSSGGALPTQEARVMRGGQEGTAFGSLTVEGEDRVHFDIARPELDLAIDPTKAPGLEWGDAHDVLDRTLPDAVAPFAGCSSRSMTPYLGRAWVRRYARNEVAVFRPQVDNVDAWRLLVADSRGQVVASFDGRSKPPREIAWNGRLANGSAAQPGLTYSYVLEARDKAGNKRNFVGPGFELPAYRLDSPDGPVYVFAGTQISAALSPNATASATEDCAPLVLEAATGMNQAWPRSPVRVTVTARNDAQARALADGIARSLAPNLMGGAARVQTQIQLAPDAAVGGSVQVAAVKSAAAVKP